MSTSHHNTRREGPTARRRIAAACDTCKRRKERCDGSIPCGRCVERGVQDNCYLAPRTKRYRRPSENHHHGATRTIPGRVASLFTPPPLDRLGSPLQLDALERQAASDSPLEHSRLIQDRKGRYMFIGDSANLSFLQISRRVVGDRIGSCAFVNDPLRCLMVEASPEGDPSWLDASSQQVAPQVLLSEAQYLVKRFLLATNCVLDLFDEAELMEHLPKWAEGQRTESAIPSPIYYLVLAIGGQTSPEDKDAFAETLFTYGRFLTARSYMEDASIRTVQSYALITMYLLGACRRNAAFMYLGIAVRAAYAIGLHRKEVAMSFPQDEVIARERLWKVLRILDLFLSASLGRPPSTRETRDTEAPQDYSASNDLCQIFENILNDVYSQRKISTETLSSIGAHHRRWASRFFRGLATDRIEPDDRIGEDGMPNIGLLHVKEAYYWTIMLLTRPFLVESVMLHVEKAKTLSHEARAPCTSSDAANKVLVHACVDSAMRTVDLLGVLLGCTTLPKRLPFVVNSLFISALVLGFASFGDLDSTFSLERYLERAQELLAHFVHDAISQRNASIIAYLQEACKAYFKERASKNMDHQSLAVGVMFGQIHRQRSKGPTRLHTPNSLPNGVAATSAPEVQDGVEETARTTVESANGAHAISTLDDYAYLLAGYDDFADLPYPNITPRTLWFDEYEGPTALFSTISNPNLNYSSMTS